MRVAAAAGVTTAGRPSLRRSHSAGLQKDWDEMRHRLNGTPVRFRAAADRRSGLNKNSLSQATISEVACVSLPPV
jgi:hypothetical protein